MTRVRRRPRSVRRGAGRPRTSLGSLADIRALPPFVRLPAATQLAFDIGFFAVLPYLAEHLGGALGMGGRLVGLVLGLRTFSRQGLFVVGGALTDRYGPRPVVPAGCVLRIAGFLWLGYAAPPAERAEGAKGPVGGRLPARGTGARGGLLPLTP